MIDDEVSLSVTPPPKELVDHTYIRQKRISHLSKAPLGDNNAAKLVDEIGNEEVDRFFENYDSKNDTEQYKATMEPNTEPTLNELSRDFDEVKAASLDFREKYETLPENLIIVQRIQSKFFHTLFRNKMRVIFAGESAVDHGGPFTEFLRLSMSYLPSDSLVFGKYNQCLFKADPLNCEQKKYFFLGQLCAAAILFIGRGPECFHVLTNLSKLIIVMMKNSNKKLLRLTMALMMFYIRPILCHIL